jgi:hypothetical protein
MIDYKVCELKRMCRERAIKGFSRKRKSELLELLGFVPQTHELEKVVRDVYDVLFPENRFRKMETRFTRRLQIELEHILNQSHLMVIEKQSSDFILADGKRMSIRGSLQSKYIYPERVGQLSVNDFKQQFTQGSDPKRWIIDHIHILLPRYLEQTVGDYLLWIDEKTAKCRLFNNPRDLFFRDLTFKRTLDKWKSKNSVKMGKFLIGDFIFDDERIRFRFNTLTLIRLLSTDRTI